MRVPSHVMYRRRKPKAAIAALRMAARLLLATSALYLLVSTLLLSSVRVGSVSMEPAVHERDRLFVAPVVYGARVPGTRARLPGFRAPARGDVVLLEAPQGSGRGVAGRAVDALVRFVTFQRAGIYPDDRSGGVSRLLVKRIVGLPGDTVRMDRFVAWVKPAGAAAFSLESALADRAYETSAGTAGGLVAETPFGGSLREILLGSGEYFVLGDNRPDSSDSRSWGPVRMERLVGPAVLRYFPLRDFGRI
jgi:signal peptidase I